MPFSGALVRQSFTHPLACPGSWPLCKKQNHCVTMDKTRRQDPLQRHRTVVTPCSKKVRDREVAIDQAQVQQLIKNIQAKMKSGEQPASRAKPKSSKPRRGKSKCDWHRYLDILEPPEEEASEKAVKVEIKVDPFDLDEQDPSPGQSLPDMPLVNVKTEDGSLLFQLPIASATPCVVKQEPLDDSE